ncbi:MAG: hypothetical protein QME68_01060 [Elusimicrobiota bacterium]|nr:hypothetical protein [Elusimicrobiota bacterium]
MKTIYILISIGVFLIGLAYFYQPKLIITFNNFMKKVFFNDTQVLLHRKKIGIIYVLLSAVIFFLGFYIPYLQQNKEFIKEIKLYRAWRYYHQGNYDMAEKLSLEVFNVDPKNLTVIKQLALVYFVKGDYRKAKYFSEKFLIGQPESKKIKVIYEESLKKLKFK